MLRLTIPTFFFFNDSPTTEIYTLSLHDALPISIQRNAACSRITRQPGVSDRGMIRTDDRSEEHTSELQSLRHLVCRLLLEKKKKATFSSIKIAYIELSTKDIPNLQQIGGN